MIKNILGCDFKYEDDKLFRFNKSKKVWTCCNNLAPRPRYIRIEINKKFYSLHRLIYKYHNDDWDITDISKNNYIDHININPSDNRIENLRVLTQSQNVRNQKKRENTSSKYIGVYKSGNKWRARIKIYGKMIDLGTYETELEAHLAYEKKYEELMDI
tara:strand:+ start:88 stop:561 length:474 start_codon:yes stop_codon:yes gene_type:complete